MCLSVLKKNAVWTFLHTPPEWRTKRVLQNHRNFPSLPIFQPPTSSIRDCLACFSKKRCIDCLCNLLPSTLSICFHFYGSNCWALWSVPHPFSSKSISIRLLFPQTARLMPVFLSKSWGKINRRDLDCSFFSSTPPPSAANWAIPYRSTTSHEQSPDSPMSASANHQ